MKSTVSGNSTVSTIGPVTNGAIGNWGTLTLTDTIVSDNTGDASFGGGIGNSGTVTVEDSVVSGNTARYGGGINNGSGGTLEITAK